MLDHILARQLFAAKGWRIVATTQKDQHRLVVDLEPTRMSAICSGCGETKHLWVPEILELAESTGVSRSPGHGGDLV